MPAPALSGLAFGAFSAAMALMRFLGDLVRDRLGAVQTFRISASLAMNRSWRRGPCALGGMGRGRLCDCRPGACQHGSDRLFRRRQPAWPCRRAWRFRSSHSWAIPGLLFAPSVIGFIAEHTGFAPIYLALPVFVAIPLVFSGLMRHARPGGELTAQLRNTRVIQPRPSSVAPRGRYSHPTKPW